MPRRSPVSARRKSSEGDRLIRALRDAVKKSKGRFPEVTKVLLFGSRARGDWGLRSDADVLVIITKSKQKRFFDRIPRYLDLFSEISLPVDVFPYTEVEFRRMREEGNRLVLTALKEGVLLS
jgi:predicted nucleotidyltransferase